MSRRTLLVPLALLQTFALLGGTAAAVALSTRAPARIHEQPPVVQAAAKTAPRPVVQPVRRTARPVVHVAPAPHPVLRAAVPQAQPAVAPPVVTLTPQQLMDAAIARIPGYTAGGAVWGITPGLGHWGIADLNSGAIYISPTVPPERMYDVVVHEWSHVLSMQAYHGNATAAIQAMNTYYSASGMDGPERAADCMAKLLGAVWTHYTPCDDPTWRAGAARLINRQPL